MFPTKKEKLKLQRKHLKHALRHLPLGRHNAVDGVSKVLLQRREQRCQAEQDEGKLRSKKSSSRERQICKYLVVKSEDGVVD